MPQAAASKRCAPATKLPWRRHTAKIDELDAQPQVDEASKERDAALADLAEARRAYETQPLAADTRDGFCVSCLQI